MDGGFLRVTRDNGKRFLESKVAIINGGSASVGMAVIKALLENGTYIACTYNKNKRAIEDLSQHAGAENIRAFQVDFLLDDYEQRIEGVLKQVKDWKGSIDILVNVAGVLWVKPFLYEREEEIRRVWRINYFVPYTFVKKSIPFMMEKGGHVINICSTASVRGFGQQVTYSCSKAALLTLTQSLSEEFAAHGILVNAVSPGPIDTPALDQYYDKFTKKLLVKNIPLDRLCGPVDVANAVLGILMNDYMTGVNFLVHGGRI